MRSVSGAGKEEGQTQPVLRGGLIMDGAAAELLNLENYKSEVHRTLISQLDLEKLSFIMLFPTEEAVP